MVETITMKEIVEHYISGDMFNMVAVHFSHDDSNWVIPIEQVESRLVNLLREEISLRAENARLRKENADLLRWNSALRGNTSKSVLRRLDSMLGEEK